MVAAQYQYGKPEKVREFDTGQKSGNFGLPVMYHHTCDNQCEYC